LIFLICFVSGKSYSHWFSCVEIESDDVPHSTPIFVLLTSSLCDSSSAVNRKFDAAFNSPGAAGGKSSAKSLKLE
jgi:hypothetical protein